MVVGVATSLAGCSGFASQSQDSTASPTAGERTNGDGPGIGSVSDPDVLLVRRDTTRPPLWFDAAEDEDGGRPTVDEHTPFHESSVIDTPARADRISAADGVDADRVETFLDDTDFATETLYLQAIQVEACFELTLCSIGWRSDKVSTDYVRQVLPYDVQCGADDHVFEGRLIRIPDALSADRVNSYASSIGTGGCDGSGSRGHATGSSGGGGSTGSAFGWGSESQGEGGQ